MKSVVLLSGGLDSYTAAAIVKSQGFEIHALTVQYGQRHAHELAAARRVAADLQVSRHLELAVDLRGVGGSAESLDARDIVIGVNALDYSGYPDCRPEFIAAFESLASLATRAGVEGTRFRVHAPLIQLSKSQIIQRGVALNLNYALTHSCYDPAPDGAACGRCDSCLLRAKGFAEAGLADPLLFP
jgi:7-cyano-7-deazaguanine synthase